MTKEHFPQWGGNLLNLKEQISPVDSPVILCGQNHYQGKGVTCDCMTEEEYESAHRQAACIPPLTKQERELARTSTHTFSAERQFLLNFKVLMRSRTSHADFAPNGDAYNDRALEIILDAARRGVSHSMTGRDMAGVRRTNDPESTT